MDAVSYALLAAAIILPIAAAVLADRYDARMYQRWIDELMEECHDDSANR